MHQSTTPSLSQTIWPRWALRQFLTVPIVQTLLPVTWLFPKLRGCRYEIIEEMKEAVRKVIDTLTQEDLHGAFHKLLEWENKCIAAGGDYFEEDSSFMCVLSIKVSIRKKSGNLFNDSHTSSSDCASSTKTLSTKSILPLTIVRLMTKMTTTQSETSDGPSIFLNFFNHWHEYAFFLSLLFVIYYSFLFSLSFFVCLLSSY